MRNAAQMINRQSIESSHFVRIYYLFLALKLTLIDVEIMSLAAPLIWIKLLTIFDIFQYFGTLQLVLRRMIYESSIFFLLIALLGIGFFQALAGLDAVDGSNDSTAMVFDSLLLAVLGSPQFELYGRDTSAYPFNTILYYSWTSLVIILLLKYVESPFYPKPLIKIIEY